MNNAKNTATEIAKQQIKKKIIGMALGSLGGCLPFFLSFVIAAIAIVLLGDLFSFGNLFGDLFDFKITINAYSETSYLAKTYATCNSINIDGNLVELNQYIAGVIDKEPAENEEILKVNAIITRTEVLYKTNGGNKEVTKEELYGEVTNNPSDKAKKAVKDTAGLVISRNDNLITEKSFTVCTKDNYKTEQCNEPIKNSNQTYTIEYKKIGNDNVNKVNVSATKYEGANTTEKIKKVVSDAIIEEKITEGKKTEEVLKEVYSTNVEVTNLEALLKGTENKSSGKGYTTTYTNKKNGQTYKNFKQFSFGIDRLTSVGCGVTATSIVVHPYSAKVTPDYIYNKYGITTSAAFYSYPHDYTHKKYCTSWSNGWCLATSSKTKLSNADMRKELISNFEKGGTAVLFISKKVDNCWWINGSDWTTSQHFFSALDYDSSTDEIYISNPGSNSKRQNGWIKIDKLSCAHVATLVRPEKK